MFGTISRGFRRDKFISLTENNAAVKKQVLKIFNKIRNRIETTEDRLSIFVAFNQMQISLIRKMKLRLMEYFQDKIIHFQYVVKIRNGVVFSHAVVNRTKM